MTATVTVLGQDAIGWVAESDGMRFYLTDCCGASATGSMGAIVCRCCYTEIDPALGGNPAQPEGRCTCMPMGEVTYGVASCGVHGTVPASQQIIPATAPEARWQAARAAHAGH